MIKLTELLPNKHLLIPGLRFEDFELTFNVFYFSVTIGLYIYNLSINIAVYITLLLFSGQRNCSKESSAGMC